MLNRCAILLLSGKEAAPGGLVKSGTHTDDAVPAGFVAPESYGASGDGSSIDTAAVNSAMGTSSPVWLTGTYRINNTVTLTTARDLWQYGPGFVYEGTQDRDAVTIGVDAAISHCQIQGVRVRSSSQSNWSNNNYVGVHFAGSAKVWFTDIRQVEGFTYGIELEGVGGPYTYGCASVGYVHNCEIGFENDCATGSNWNNDNVFMGGRYVVDSGINTSVDRVGFRHWSSAGGYSQANAIVTHAPVFELDTGGAGNAIAVWSQGYYCVYEGLSIREADIVLQADGGTSSYGRWLLAYCGYTPATLTNAHYNTIGSYSSGNNGLSSHRNWVNTGGNSLGALGATIA